MKGLFDLSEINKVDLYDQVLEIENEILDYNNYEWSWSMGSEKDILRILNELLDDFDFRSVDYIHDYGFMWCGILPDFPFSELDLNEETILNIILQDFLYIEQDKDKIYLACKPTNSKSSLYKFFYKNRDEAGGNFEYAINDMIRTISKWMIKKVKENPDHYGEWEQAIYPVCPECEQSCHHWESSKTFDCFTCGYSCKMSEIETIETPNW